MIRRRGLTIAAAVALAAAALTPQVAGAQTQVTNKWVTTVLQAEPPDLEGCYSMANLQGAVLKQNVIETLIYKKAADGTLHPRLATGWERVQPDLWRIKLRNDVTFHDGQKFNAQAVKKSLDRVSSSAFVCRDRAKFLNDIKIEVTAVDDVTVDIKASRADPIMPMRLAGIGIVGPNEPLDKKSLKPVGTGPYVVDRWESGQQILISRNAKYWGKAPAPDGMRYIWRSESSVRAAMVKLGEADIAPSIAEQDAVDPKTDVAFLNSETTFLRIDTTIPPLNDKRVRLALNYAFDRDTVRGTILSKDYVNATQMVMPNIPGHNFEIDKRVRTYDPVKAKQLMAEAKAEGVPVDAEIWLYGRPAAYPEATEVAEAALTMYKAVGFNMKLKHLEPGEYARWNNKPFPEGRGPTILQNSHDNAFGDAMFSLPYRYMCSDGNNSPMCDPKLDDEITRVALLSGEDRTKGLQEIFRRMYDDYVAEVWQYHMVGYARVNPRVNFIPDVTTNNEVKAEDITFK